MRVGYPEGRSEPHHGSLMEDMIFMAECTLATVEDLEMKSRPPKGELQRQRQLARFAVSSAIFHGAVNQAEEQMCGRVAKVLDHYHDTGKLIMHWENESE